ncbi:MAG: hypothetical protein QOH80_585, partial [Actinomycetota bacterium]|nr:hypothetical protein [Actinomycetota bacterium]
MNRPSIPAVAVVVVLLAAGGGSVIAGTPTPDRAPAQPAHAVPVVRAAAACPQPLDATGAQTTVGVAAPGLLGASRAVAAGTGTGTGTARLEDLAGSRELRLALSEASGTAVPRLGSPALLAVGAGSRAPGFAASEAARIPSGDLRGLAGTDCAAAGTDFWFVGSGAEVGQRGRLYLTNPESAPALVDVTLYGPAGVVDAPIGKGVSVAAGSQHVLLLDALAPGISRFGVHVQVRQGRIAAALRDQQIRGLDPRGGGGGGG